MSGMNRAERRRAERRAPRRRRSPGGHQHTNLPVIPGVIPENTAEWRQTALDQAHEDLPKVPGTRIAVKVFTVGKAFASLTVLGYTAEQLAMLKAKVDQAVADGAPDPHVVVAFREPHDGFESPTGGAA